MGLLDLFRKKEYKREEYEAALRGKKYRSEALGKAKDRVFKRDHDIQVELEELESEVNYNQAKKKLDKLYRQGEKEAIKFNRQYDTLITKLRKNAKEVYDFEESKLGMHKNKEGGLAKITSVIGLIAGLFFLSPNLTGNVIGDLTSSTSNIIGSIFLIVGLIGGFFWIRVRR